MRRKVKFRRRLFVVLVSVIIGIAIYVVIINLHSVRKMNHYIKTIDVYHSTVDQDKDGIDDQSDIYENAIAYVSTRPSYESKWYATGYPDDNYGVCTDVVANALKNAGYDLMQLVYEDRINFPERYADEVIDINIDFRRVRNLKIYFDHHAISLTTSFDDITLWQGGDIITYQDHIGIVSRRRNHNGIPYIIHHYGKNQFKYETDTIQVGNITGHYRIS